ncbi:MerR family transcriptional regulator (plasmid) [Staphylococcus hominis]|nr:MerR family transcriptional regulator [Staphylococcus hominis]
MVNVEYTVNEVSKLANISNRTLRYYDEIGLLPPKYIQENGYRIYGDEEIEILSIILLYKAIGMKLNEIQEIINSTDFDKFNCLNIQLKELLMKRKQLDVLIDFVEDSLKKNNVSASKSIFDCL